MNPTQAAEISDRLLRHVRVECCLAGTCDSPYYDWAEEAIDRDTLLDEAARLRDYLEEPRT